MRHPKIISARISAQVHMTEILVSLTKAEIEPRNYLRAEWLSEVRFACAEVLREIEAAIEAEKSVALNVNNLRVLDNK